jgi:peptidylprolyl isomerase
VSSVPARCAAVLVAALVLATGCSGALNRSQVRSAEGSITGLTVSGEPGTEPVVRIATPLAVPTTQTEVTVAGAGAPVQVDQLFVLELTLYDARTGAKAFSTYAPGSHALAAKTTDDTLFPKLSTALVGQKQGSRIVLAMAAADSFGAGGVPPRGVQASDPVVVVADVVSVPPTDTIPAATGAALALPTGLPRIIEDPSGPSSLATGGLRAPRGVVVVQLIAGTGPPVRDRSLVSLDYLGQVWGSGEPFADTYFKDPVLAALGTGTSPPAWQRGLVGVRRGSRVLVIAPAALAGVPGAPGAPTHGTIAWVIDVLGVS